MQSCEVDNQRFGGSNEDLEVMVGKDATAVSGGNTRQQGHCCKRCSLIILVNVRVCKLPQGALEGFGLGCK